MLLMLRWKMVPFRRVLTRICALFGRFIARLSLVAWRFRENEIELPDSLCLNGG
jgi:hypothetical protein